MFSTSTTRRMAVGLAAVSLVSGFALSAGAAPAAADPQQLSALVGAGSDTTQDVINAMSGYNYGVDYTAINAGSSYSYRHITSWDAAPAQTASDNCITPVINGPTFTRPNGSGAGRKALYASSTSAAAGWTGSTFTLDSGTVLPVCASAVNIGGTVNFARSSSLKSGTGSDVLFVPFARDAVTFASYRPGGGQAVTTLSRKNLIDAFAGSTRVTIDDPDGSGTLTIIPCGIQTSSGTMQFFRDTVTQSDSTKEEAATSQCNAAGSGSRLQESKGDLLKAKGDALDATLDDFVVIAGYSAAAYIAQANGVSSPNGYSDITIGSISDDSTSGTGGANLGSPVTGTAPNLAPNATFYASAGIGRNVYNVIRKSNLVNVATGNALSNAYVAIFADTDTDANNDGSGHVDNSSTKNSSALCQQGARIQLFGFAEIESCGDYSTYSRAWDTGVA